MKGVYFLKIILDDNEYLKFGKSKDIPNRVDKLEKFYIKLYSFVKIEILDMYATEYNTSTEALLFAELFKKGISGSCLEHLNDSELFDVVHLKEAKDVWEIVIGRYIDTSLTGHKNENKLKRVLIKEELMCITKDATTAIILNQFIYWSERVKDISTLINEEYLRSKMSKTEVNSLNAGWIWKPSYELADEIMVTNSEATVRRHISKLVNMGLLFERKRSWFRGDKTLEYRVNFIKLWEVLAENNYPLDGYILNKSKEGNNAR